MSVVGYCSPFVPPEWIAAHGLTPRRLRLRATENLTRGVCPYAGAMMDVGVPAASGCSAFVLTTTCDQMRYVAAILQLRNACPVFLMNVPSMCETPASRQLYYDELRRLGRFLVERGGHDPTADDLSRHMLAFERKRSENRPQDTNENGRRPTAGGEVAAIPLAILGGPLMENDREFFGIIEQAGGRVVLDATEDGERCLPRPFDPARLAFDPLRELAGAYFEAIPDAFRRPNSRLIEWLAVEIAARHIRGIILRRYLWCDLWHAVLGQLRQQCRTPVLEVDVGPDDIASPNRIQGRIEAFLETLR
jgi:benzoyl-CoA reductase/2-hydroxyglutaryl-CoA dehydratase subunit BcrC/BadD/HgdB